MMPWITYPVPLYLQTVIFLQQSLFCSNFLQQEPILYNSSYFLTLWKLVLLNFIFVFIHNKIA
jgi:hypothetical protein